MIYTPVKGHHRPLLYWRSTASISFRHHVGDLAIDVRDLMNRVFDVRALPLLKKEGITNAYVWFSAFARPKRSDFDRWADEGLDGVLLADFDYDGPRMLLCPERHFAGVVYARSFSRQPHRIEIAAKILDKAYAKPLYYIADFPTAKPPEAITHVKADQALAAQSGT
jgi:hypothetical protein